MNEAEGHWPKIGIGTHETGLRDLREATQEDLDAAYNAPTTVRPTPNPIRLAREAMEAAERSQQSAQQS